MADSAAPCPTRRCAHFRCSVVVDFGSLESPQQEIILNTIIYIVGLVVVIGAVLAFLGLR